MCTYNIAIDDAVMEEVRPHFAGDAAMQSWIEKVLHQALKKYAAQFKAQTATNGDSVYKQVKALESDPDGLFKLGGILKPSQFSNEELRDGYICEKHGI